ncbi:hypothetical protein N8E86_05880 [Avibacterium paragallinarum]|uniref:hypothetical protein n=1 Tax=Avibacterium paragallinarum TaxID=728 RepID=UPI0021F7EFE1|nr:hypothetical protein [Avibacterium paragallinarum]UXN33628.1 hypothetical protein N8E86_05880 [Avibacterium paragallinarum]
MDILISIFTNQFSISIALLLLLTTRYFINDIDDEKRKNRKTFLLTIPIVIFFNISLMKYFSSHFNIKQFTEFLNPTSGTLLLSIANVLAALNIMRKNKNITLFIHKNQLMISVSTALFTTLFYIMKPILMSTYYSAIDQATSALTLNSLQQYPIFRELFPSITIEALYFIAAITIAFEISIFTISYNKENGDKKNFYLTFLTLFFIFLFSASHITYLTKMLTEKVLTNQNTGYLIVQYEYYPLNERCDNPHLIELSKTGKYWFKSISHNKIVYVEGIWNDHISKEERTLENIEEYRFHPFEEECMKTIK